jgi:hypothetical protein
MGGEGIVYSGTKKVEYQYCFHCGFPLYDISVLYGEKYNGELYCTHCNISITEKSSGGIDV